MRWLRATLVNHLFTRVYPISDVSHPQVFRHAGGAHAPDGAVTLFLSDFAPPEFIPASDDPLPTISIPYLTLAGFLARSEARQ